MKGVLIFIFFFYSSLFYGRDDVDIYRKLLILANENIQYAKMFYDQFNKPTNENSPTIMGYKAMSYFMMSKHVLNPYNKLMYFKKGKLCIDKAIVLDANNVELLYLRYCVQINVPKFLNYHNNISIDKKKIELYLQSNSNVQKLSSDFLNKIKQTLNKIPQN